MRRLACLPLSESQLMSRVQAGDRIGLGSPSLPLTQLDWLQAAS